jgi:hypothetical protein
MRRTLAAVVAILALAPASAQASTVTGGHLDWTITNVFDSTAPAGTQRTWLGYATSSPPPQGANGTAAPIAPATGDTVTPSSTRGVDYRFSYPATSGTYDEYTGTGTVELAGAVSFTAPAFPAGHGFTITIENPQVVLEGLTGRLYASGQGEGATDTYDRSAPVFTLDLSEATVTLHADGSRTIGPIAPAIATSQHVFPAPYNAGAGPDRTPNTFGAFSLRLALAPIAGGSAAGVPGPQGETGPPGATGQAGPRGRSVLVTRLARAPFGGRALHRVRVTPRGSTRTLAWGTVRGRTLRVTLSASVQRLRGRYVLRPVAASRRPVTISVP